MLGESLRIGPGRIGHIPQGHGLRIAFIELRLLARALADLMALRNHGCMPGPNTQIAFIGDPLSGRAKSFFSNSPAGKVSACACSILPARWATWLFLVDAVDPDHWSLDAPSGLIDAAECAQDHRFALQAMLLATMSA
ncbi:hypothetical protein [Variovorax sp. Root434]|uniref:hypothetical protein n=1 Tax=Variovorax sp. Root434 TaxID=1736536 RepID=UPI0006F5C530|nr:hypothetical protein [Variovorax sp. Root434]KQX21452.1 hypothetical protein ASD05_18020 [Variovorax sp. Root434]